MALVNNARPLATCDKSSRDRRAIFVSINDETANVDLLFQQQQFRFGELRCIYVDTMQQVSGNGCIITCDTGQRINVATNTQGYYPLFSIKISSLEISSNAAVELILFDFDQPSFAWSNSVDTLVSKDGNTTNGAILSSTSVQSITNGNANISSLFFIGQSVLCGGSVLITDGATLLCRFPVDNSSVILPNGANFDVVLPCNLTADLQMQMELPVTKGYIIGGAVYVKL